MAAVTLLMTAFLCIIIFSCLLYNTQGMRDICRGNPYTFFHCCLYSFVKQGQVVIHFLNWYIRYMYAESLSLCTYCTYNNHLNSHDRITSYDFMHCIIIYALLFFGEEIWDCWTDYVREWTYFSFNCLFTETSILFQCSIPLHHSTWL